jgi:hypothetical protein
MKKLCHIIACIIVLLLGSSCTTTSIFPPGAEGYWYAPGYGAILEIASGDRRDSVHYFEVTEVSLLEQEFFLVDLPGYYFQVIDESHAVTGVEETSWNYQLERIDGLPETQPYRTPTQDYQINFEVLWHTFNERYAFFEKRGIDWDAVYQNYATKAARCESDDEFYTLVVEVLDLFDDNHILFYRSEDDPGWYDDDAFRADWIRQEDVARTFETLVEIQRPFSFRTAGEVFQEELWYPYMDVIQNTYLSGDYVSCCQDMIFYGMLDDATGYIAVLKEDYDSTERRGTISRQDAKSQRFLRFELILFIKTPSIITKINHYLIFP